MSARHDAADIESGLQPRDLMPRGAGDIYGAFGVQILIAAV